MESKEFLKIRRNLKMTQNRLSQVLCISPKAVQSFEQGWRKVPVYIEREMLLLFALNNAETIKATPTACWEIKNCPDFWKENCLIWKLRTRHFCWYINGTFCQGKVHRNWGEKIRICKECEVYCNDFKLLDSTDLPT